MLGGHGSRGRSIAGCGAAVELDASNNVATLVVTNNVDLQLWPLIGDGNSDVIGVGQPQSYVFRVRNLGRALRRT